MCIRDRLNVSNGGSIGRLFDAGAEGVPSTNVEVNVSGGGVGDGFDAFGGSTVNISGGTVRQQFSANSGSTINISGGIVEFGFDAESGSTVNISGGTVGVGSTPIAVARSTSRGGLSEMTSTHSARSTSRAESFC